MGEVCFRKEGVASQEGGCGQPRRRAWPTRKEGISSVQFLSWV